MTTPARNDLVRLIVHPMDPAEGGSTTFAWQFVDLRRPRGSAPDGIHHATCETCSETVTVAVMSEDGLAAAKRRKRSVGLAALLIPAVAWASGVGTGWFDRAAPALLPITVVLTVFGALFCVAMLLKARGFDGITTADAVHHITDLAVDPLTCERCGHTETLPRTIDIRTFQQDLLDARMRAATHVCGSH